MGLSMRRMLFWGCRLRCLFELGVCGEGVAGREENRIASCGWLVGLDVEIGAGLYID